MIVGWALMGLAHATALDFVRFQLNADNGVVLTYEVLGGDYQKVMDRVVQEPPKVMVTVESGGMKRSTLVHLKAQSGVANIAPGAWPKGLVATVTHDDWGKGEFTTLSLEGGRDARTHRVNVSGGVDGASPGPSLPTPSPRPTRPNPQPQPAPVRTGVQVQPISPDDALRAVQDAARLAHAARLAAEERRRKREADAQYWAAYREQQAQRAAHVESIRSNPSHPITAACQQSFGSDFETCLGVAAFRWDSHFEVQACGAIGNVGRGIDCLKQVAKIRWNAGAVVEACITSFPAASMECVEQVGKSAVPPEPDLVASCSQAFPDPDRAKHCLLLAGRPYALEEVLACSRLESLGHRRECVERVEEPIHQPSTVVNACVDAFGDGVEALRCFNVVLEAPAPPEPNIRACAAALDSSDDRMQCIKRLRASTFDPAPMLLACKTAFPAAQMECFHTSVAGVSDLPDVALAHACSAAFDDDEDGLECVKRMRRRPNDPAGSVGACQALFTAPKDRLECVERARRDPDPSRIEACEREEKSGKRLKCVEG